MTPLSLDNLQSPPREANKPRKRIGRGNAAGQGTYAGKGLKGQKSRSGVSGLKIKGMRRRLLSVPKLRGFKSGKQKAETVNIGDLDRVFEDKTTVTPRILTRAGLIDTPRFGVKILSGGDTKKAFIIQKCRVSATAKEKLEKAGGKIE